jgi:hypothetical protein
MGLVDGCRRRPALLPGFLAGDIPLKIPSTGCGARETAIAAFAAWLERYERAAASKATCRFVETVGSGWLHPEIAPIVRLHDERTKAESGLPLA